MLAVAEGFAAIAGVIALGALLAHLGVLDDAACRALTRVAFYVASPALMVSVLGSADVRGLFSGYVLAVAAGALASGVAYLVLALLVLRPDPTSRAVGVLSATYVNAGNLGLPVAAYVLGDAALIAPVLVLQMVVLQPLALTVLDRTAAGRTSLLRTVTTPVRNPVTVGALVGLGLGLSGLRLPAAVSAPLDLVAGMAVPAMLLAFGLSLRLDRRTGVSSSRAEVAAVTACKALVHPSVAVLVALALGLDREQLLAAVVLSALPTAQNVFVIAARYEHEKALLTARDAVSATTLVSAPVIVLGAAVLL